MALLLSCDSLSKSFGARPLFTGITLNFADGERTGLIGPEHVGPGAIVVDVGTNATADGGLAGDVDPKAAEVAGALSPVPGGVGPVTTALLLRHVTDAAAGL